MKRRPSIKQAALKRCAGRCEACGYDAEADIAAMLKAMDGECDRKMAVAIIAAGKGWGSKTALLEVDHIKPLWFGGRDVLANVRVLCIACHRARTSEQAPMRAKAKRMQKRRAKTRRILAGKAGRV